MRLGADPGRARSPTSSCATSQPGAIVLLHDSARYAYRESALATAEALPRMIAAAREQGLESRSGFGAERAKGCAVPMRPPA